MAWSGLNMDVLRVACILVVLGWAVLGYLKLKYGK